MWFSLLLCPALKTASDENKTDGNGKQYYNLCKSCLQVSTQKWDHKRFDWLITYTMQDVDLKYLHKSTDYETNIQILINVCE